MMQVMRRISRWILRAVGLGGDFHFTWEFLLPLAAKWFAAVAIAVSADLPWYWSLLAGAGILLIVSVVIEGFISLPGKVRSWKSPTGWLVSVRTWDRDNLPATIHQMGDRQYGNVTFALDDEHKPSIWAVFHFVNASIYTLELESVEGSLQVEGNVVSGGWEFAPFAVEHGRSFVLKLRWVVSTDASVAAARRILESGQKVHVNFDAVKLKIRANEEPEITTDLRIPQQWWQPREDTIARFVTTSFEVRADERDTVLYGVVNNNSGRALTGVKVRLEKSEHLSARQSDSVVVPYDYGIQQSFLPWKPEASATKNVGPLLRGSNFEVVRLPDNSSVATLPNGKSGSGNSFTSAGCSRLTISIYADNLAPIVRTVDFRLDLSQQPGERIVLSGCTE